MWNSWPHGTMSVAAMIGSAGPDGIEAVGVPKLDALGTLEEEEVAQGPLAEGHEGELHPGRVPLRLVGHVRPGDVRRRPHGRDSRLLTRAQCSISWAATPRITERHRSTVVEVLGRERLVGLGLQAEGGVEVLAHQPVLELRRLAQQVGERLAILDDDGWFRRHCAASYRSAVTERTWCV